MNVSAVFVHATTLDPIDFHSLYFYSHIFMQILGYGIKIKKNFMHVKQCKMRIKNVQYVLN